MAARRTDCWQPVSRSAAGWPSARRRPPDRWPMGKFIIGVIVGVILVIFLIVQCTQAIF